MVGTTRDHHVLHGSPSRSAYHGRVEFHDLIEILLLAAFAMVAFAIVGLGLSLTTDRWGMTAFFVLSLAFYIFIIVGGRWQERRVWTQLLRAASVNGWASPSGLD